MNTRGETDWQSEKSLTECMRYMLENQIGTDVCFEVGPPGGETEKIRAHKYMLISRSSVFEAMFSSGMTECTSGPEAKVRVEDIDADIFRDVLNYIYCESIPLCPESAVHLMYAAKKYILPKLVRECCKCISDGLDEHNVIHFLDQSLDFDHQQLTSDCLKHISLNAKAILNGSEILSSSRRVMETVLEAEAIPVKESVMYEITINWAKHQLQSRPTVPPENPTDLLIRETIGDLLYKIRFPVMRPSEFAEISSGINVLTAEEKEAVYYFLSTKKKVAHLMFPTKRRMGEEMFVDRTVHCVVTRNSSEGFFGMAPMAPRSSCVDAINFKTNLDILLTGVGLYTASKENGYDVDVEILQSTNSLFKKRFKIPYSGDSNPTKIPLDEPIVIRARVVYSVKTLAHDAIRHFGESCQAVCTKDAVKFMFLKHTESFSTTETRGQIPRLYFCNL